VIYLESNSIKCSRQINGTHKSNFVEFNFFIIWRINIAWIYFDGILIVLCWCLLLQPLPIFMKNFANEFRRFILFFESSMIPCEWAMLCILPIVLKFSWRCWRFCWKRCPIILHFRISASHFWFRPILSDFF